jgi:carbon-monoxide dehydrogenase medium subunit
VQVPAPFENERATSIEHALELLAELGLETRLLARGHSSIRWAAEHSTQEVSG